MTRKRTGSSPIVVSASTSWLTRIVPISAANARAGAAGEQDRRHQRPELAQHRQPDQVGDEDLGAELASSGSPTGTRGSRRAGTKSARRSAARRRRRARRSATRRCQRIVDWMQQRVDQRRRRLPMNTICWRRSSPHARGDDADFLDRPGAAAPADRGRWLSACGSNCCSSVSNAGFRFATYRRPPVRCCSRSTSSAMPAPSQ